MKTTSLQFDHHTLTFLLAPTPHSERRDAVKVDQQAKSTGALCVDRKAISWRSWLAGSCCRGEEGRDAALLTSHQDFCAAVPNFNRTGGYESSSRQAGADINPRLHPLVLIPIVTKWARRGYNRHFPSGHNRLLTCFGWIQYGFVRSVYIRGDSRRSPSGQSLLRRGRRLQRQIHRLQFVFCFAGVCGNALLKESLVVDGCSDEGV